MTEFSVRTSQAFKNKNLIVTSVFHPQKDIINITFFFFFFVFHRFNQKNIYNLKTVGCKQPTRPAPLFITILQP